MKIIDLTDIFLLFRHEILCMIKRHQWKRLSEIFDENSIKILKILSKGEITDQAIAEKMMIRANTIRRILNEMHTKGIITYRKEKERSGWYNYIWRINYDKIEEFINMEKDNYIQYLEDRLKFEQENHFFRCSDGCVKLEYANALEADFKCPLCNSQLVHYNNKKDIRQIKQELKALKG